MKKSNMLFITMTAVSVILIGMIMGSNIASMRPGSPDPTDTATVSQALSPTGLPLHEAKYWKAVHE